MNLALSASVPLPYCLEQSATHWLVVFTCPSLGKGTCSCDIHVSKSCQRAYGLEGVQLTPLQAALQLTSEGLHFSRQARAEDCWGVRPTGVGAEAVVGVVDWAMATAAKAPVRMTEKRMVAD